MSQFTEWLTSSLLRNSLTLIVAALIVATCIKWMRLRSPAGEQWAWLLVLIQGVMFVWLTIPVPGEWLQPAAPRLPQFRPAEIDVPLPDPDPQGTHLRYDVPVRDPSEPAHRQMEVIVEAERDSDLATTVAPRSATRLPLRDRLPSWPVVVFAMWVTGVAVILVLGLARYVAFIRRLRHARPAPLDWSDEWRRQCGSEGVQTAIPLLVSDNIGPALCRLPGGYRLVVPQRLWNRLSAAERAAVFRHELAHLSRGDVWWTLFARLLAGVHWFNPCAWWAARRYEAQSEFACDTAAAGDDPAAFSELLVQLASNRSRRIAGVQSVAAGSVYERVRRLLETRRRRSGLLALVPVTVALLAVIAAGIRVEAMSDRAANSESADAAERGLADAGSRPNSKTAAGELSLPSVKELAQAIAVHEQAYARFHIKSRETFVMSEGLTDQERGQYPWADGRKHEMLTENAQLEPGTWMSLETRIVDGVPEPRFDCYVQDGREVQVHHRIGLSGGIEVHLSDPQIPAQEYVWSEPLHGLFPLLNRLKPVLLSVGLQEDETKVAMQHDGDDAALTIVRQVGQYKERVKLWLSRAHDWHPIRCQRYFNGDAQSLLSDWEATKIERQAGQWRLLEGRVQWFDLEAAGKSRKSGYTKDFVIHEAHYGEAVSADLFKYEIPSGATITDATKSPLEDAPELTRDFVVSVIDVGGQPVPDAVVTSRTRGLTALQRDLTSATTDDKGAATVRVPDGEFAIKVEQPGSREASWIVGGNPAEMKVILAPLSSGRVIDESGAPRRDIWISSRDEFQFRADGLIHDPRNSVGALQRNAWSDDQGQFALTSELTLRRTSDEVLLSAIDSEQSRMAFVHVPAARLAEPITVELRPVCSIEGSCVLEGVTEPTDVRLSVEDTEGRSLASVTPVTTVVAEGLRVAFKLRLPPGEYRLQSRRTSLYSTISLPLRVPEGQPELRLEPALVPPSGVQALIGRPAPELEGTWRDGEATSLQALRGNVVILDFWGYWCGPCLAGMPHLMDIADEYRDRPVKWLAIHDPHDLTREELEQRLSEIAREQWKGRELSFPVMIDAATGDDERSGVTGERYDVREWPTTIVIDRDGKVAGPVTINNLRDKIDALLK